MLAWANLQGLGPKTVVCVPSKAIDAWLAAGLIDPDAYRTGMRAWVTQAYRGGADNPIHELERGEGDPSDFERALAGALMAPTATISVFRPSRSRTAISPQIPEPIPTPT